MISNHDQTKINVAKSMEHVTEDNRKMNVSSSNSKTRMSKNEETSLLEFPVPIETKPHSDGEMPAMDSATAKLVETKVPITKIKTDTNKKCHTWKYNFR